MHLEVYFSEYFCAPFRFRVNGKPAAPAICATDRPALPTMKRTRKTRAELFAVALAYTTNEKTESIAARFGVHRSAVHHAAASFGLEARGRRAALFRDPAAQRATLARTARRLVIMHETNAALWRLLAKIAKNPPQT